MDQPLASPGASIRAGIEHRATRNFIRYHPPSPGASIRAGSERRAIVTLLSIWAGIERRATRDFIVRIYLNFIII